MGLTLSPPGESGERDLTYGLSESLPLAASVDLSGDLPPVGDQGIQGSCAAWATSYYYKTWSEKQEHAAWDLDNPMYQFSPSFMYNQINGGVDDGASFYDAFSLLETKGDVDIAEMPYDQNDYTTQPTTAQLEAAKPYRIPAYSQPGWGYFFLRSTNGPYSSPNDISTLKAWLNSGEMLVMAIPIYWDFFDDTPYYDYDGSSGFSNSGHGVAIVGYDDNANPSGADADHRGGFKMVNSWGPSWNGDGTVYLSYDFVKRYVWEAWWMGDLGPDGPSISSLSSNAGLVGQQIEIRGKNFGADRRSADVRFNGTSASVVSFTDAKVTATVPAGATTGQVRVYDWEGTSSNGVDFTVGMPTVAGISPAGGRKGTKVTVTGTHFGSIRGSSSVRFGSVACASGDYVSWSDTQVVVKTPVDAFGRCQITVRTGAGTSNGLYYKVQPIISTVNPTSGRCGSIVTITGYGFGSFSSGYTVVYFGGVRSISYPMWTKRKIQARVPQNARGTVYVVVKTAGGTSWGKSFKVL
jgi:hypothetical protein